MNPLGRVVFIGNSLPRRCGIATFTTDLQEAISCAGVGTSIAAMTEPGKSYDYPAAVNYQICDNNIDDYVRAADDLNGGGFDVACLQHEFGIFGGEAGDHIMALLSRLNMPIVTTLHTVLSKPTALQRRALDGVLDVSARIIVMADKGREILRTVHQVPANKIELIPHGIPDMEYVEPDRAKAKLGFSGKTVILTFGLLSPNKGIELMIDAMPSILKSRADAVYVVLGATHPNLVRHDGESYRNSLRARVEQLGISNHVMFLDKFVDQATLLDFISMCDVYVTPYHNKSQMTSGTLAYSFGLGKPVVSTPYWHARELLADGRGILVPFGDSPAIGRAIAALLTDEPRRQAMRKRAYTSSRPMTWERTARRYLAAFESARRHKSKVIAPLELSMPARSDQPLPDMKIDHFLFMCDDTGLFQHAVHSVPDRSHGYCVDDNARALLLACALAKPGERQLPETLTTQLAAFVQHAWNPVTKRFRNFMSFDRRWLEAEGSEDSHGRTLWALGECARSDMNVSRRTWAASLFARALPISESFSSPRAWAFTLLGLDGYCTSVPGDAVAQRIRILLADRLVSIMSAVETKEWVWFEEGLAYDNARLCQALIVTGIAAINPEYVQAGIQSLSWLVAQQTAPLGHFRPVGTEGFGNQRKAPEAFDQQPVEATATISACLAALQADGNDKWMEQAKRAFSWFLGRNDLALPLVDLETGACRDGLHRDRPNENRGGESVVSYLLGLSDLRRIARESDAGIAVVARLA